MRRWRTRLRGLGAMGGPSTVAYPAGNRNGILTTQGSAQMVGTSLLRKNANFALTNIRARYTNWRVTATSVETDNAFLLTIVAATLEYPVGGTKYPLTVGGQTTWTVPTAVAYVETDPLPITIPANAQYKVHTLADAGSGGTYLYGIVAKSSIDGYQNGASVPNLTATTGYAATGFFRTYGPALVIGDLASADTATRLFILNGDSLTYGGAGAFTNIEMDPAGGDANGNFGGISRYLGSAGFGFINMAVQSTKMSEQYNAVMSRRFGLLSGLGRSQATVLQDFGRNDLASSTAIQMSGTYMPAINANFLTIGPVRNFGGTIYPATTTTDDWVTTVNQTVLATESVRVTYNDTVRAGTITGQVGYVDFSLAEETSLNSGIIKVTGGAWVGDTTGHPRIVGAAGIATALSVPA